MSNTNGSEPKSGKYARKDWAVDDDSYYREAVRHCAGDGEHTDKDAYPSCRKMADRCDVQAMYAVGVMFLRGQGVSRDVKMANYFLYNASIQGCASAMNEYAVSLVTGDGCEKSDEAAVFWFEKAMNCGSAAGKVNFEKMKAEGCSSFLDGVKAQLEQITGRKQ